MAQSNGNAVANPARRAFINANTDTETLLKLKSDYTLAMGEAVFANARLQKQNEELTHYYNACLHMIEQFGKKQQEANLEVHNKIVEPLQNENCQLRQQVFVEQAHVQIGIQNRAELESDLTIKFQAKYEQEFEQRIQERQTAMEKSANKWVEDQIRIKEPLLHTQLGLRIAELEQRLRNTEENRDGFERRLADMTTERNGLQQNLETMTQNRDRAIQSTNAWQAKAGNLQNTITELENELDGYRGNGGPA